MIICFNGHILLPKGNRLGLLTVAKKLDSYRKKQKTSYIELANFLLILHLKSNFISFFREIFEGSYLSFPLVKLK